MQAQFDGSIDCEQGQKDALRMQKVSSVFSASTPRFTCVPVGTTRGPLTVGIECGGRAGFLEVSTSPANDYIRQS